MAASARNPFVILIYSVLILSTLLVFWQVRSFGFVNYDDDVYVYENQQVLNGLSPDGVVWAFTTGHASNWHPLTWLSHMLDCRLFGTDPGLMHLVNVLLHLANALLLFTILRRMTGAMWQSAFVAAAFALHPMHVESVAWIAERKDVLSTFFLLLTLAAYTGYVKRPSTGRYLLTLALFAAGLMAKPMLVTLPLLLLLLDYWPLNRLGEQSAEPRDRKSRKTVPSGGGSSTLYRLMVEKVPFFALSVVSCAITFVVQQSGGAVVNALALKDRVSNAFLSYARYTGRMFWPDGLAPFYPFDIGSFSSWQVALCVLLLLAVSVAVVHFGRRQKYLLVGWFWFVVALVPVIGLVQVGRHSFADRYTYVPYVGLFIIVAWGLPELFSRWPRLKMAPGLAAIVALIALGLCAHRQVGYWNNSIALFSHTIEVTRDNALAQNNIGTAYGAMGRWSDTIEPYNRAISIRPDYAEAYNNRGVSYCRLGRWQEAIDDFTRAIGIKANYAEAYNNLGAAYNAIGRRQEAIDVHRRAIGFKPDYADARYNLANELVPEGGYDEAVEQYRQALRLKPDWPDCLNNFALLIATNPEVRNRDAGEAVRLASRACELAGYENPAFLATLAASYAFAGRFGEAVDTAGRAAILADAANQPKLSEIIRYHLSFYKQGKPYIEPSVKPRQG